MTDIYIISDGELYKVGIAKDPGARLKTLQVGNPRELTLVEVIPCKNRCQAMMRERQIHRAGRKSRIRGEWFTEQILSNKYLNRYRRKHDSKQRRCS